ncbi:MAG: DUF1285 domain-containing protein [Parvularculaceae bacterium]|nr:DUF1285 domain-containing protein [Parvularculaceae bacterium]
MSDLLRYAADLHDAKRRPAPPVEKWNPPYSGEIDIVIRRDGVWEHEGAPIARAALVRLFSTVLRKEGARHFLVTPVEKLAIKVVDAPFVAVLMQCEGEGDERRISFKTSLGDEVEAGRAHPISYRQKDGEWTPYIEVRAGLEALIARSVFYELVAVGETREIDGEPWFGVTSAGVFFPFRPAREIFAATV